MIECSVTDWLESEREVYRDHISKQLGRKMTMSFPRTAAAGLLLLILLSGLTSSALAANCTAFSASCNQCTSSGSCVWCTLDNANATCVSGNIFGPDTATCSSYYSSASCSISGQVFWIIIGCSSGGVLIILLIFLYCCCCRRSCMGRRHHTEYVPLSTEPEYDFRQPTEGSVRRAELREKWQLDS
jgi:hypothetical protein